ncbi:ANTAR domain-containing protein [Streptomyces sp. MST-110588]|uniref:ANTAR domain-containing protein n=1 Tax=Streptomyces sp. MST-110588 TaxID=2833628 RepID=UPI001F5D1153|nr:ANTAR domain-containing protein [Streptomyces sp. MST-110588]UNO38846.1 ANTAR domain-containing protein [Streptomyces sp. MST-110588]
MQDQPTLTPLAQALLELTDMPASGFDAATQLRVLAVRSRSLAEAQASGAVLVDGRGRQVCAAASDEETLAVEASAGHWETGCPLRDCWQAGKPLPEIPLAHPYARGRWPRYAPAALARGFTSVSARPLRHGDRVLGAVSLLADGPGRLGLRPFQAAQALADAAAIGLAHHRRLDGEEAPDAPLTTDRIMIEQAKGMLAERRRISVAAAADLLRRWARDRELRMVDAARQVIEGARAAPRHT